MRKLLVLLMCVGLVGCATMQLPPPVTTSYGNSDLAKYKTFSVFNTTPSNTAAFLRDYPILKDIAYRFQQEGFQFVDSIDKADFAITAQFLDATGQKYIPPEAYTRINYDTDATGVTTATAVTTTTGGYSVPTYGVGLAMNVYETKTKKLVWSGYGASEAEITNIYPFIDNIILGIIDKNVITPVFVSGTREQIRKAEKEEPQNESLKPSVAKEKIGFYEDMYKDEIDGFGILCSVDKDKRGWLGINLSVMNKTNKEADFKLSDLKVTYEGKNLYIYNKSEVADAFFRAGDSVSNRDGAVRMVYQRYFEDHKIIPNENFIGYLLVATPIIFPEGSKVTVNLTINGNNIAIDYIYQKEWLTFEAKKKKYSLK